MLQGVGASFPVATSRKCVCIFTHKSTLGGTYPALVVGSSQDPDWRGDPGRPGPP